MYLYFPVIISIFAESKQNNSYKKAYFVLLNYKNQRSLTLKCNFSQHEYITSDAFRVSIATRTH